MTSQRFAFLSQRLANCPLMIHPRKAEVVCAAVFDRMGYGRPLAAQPGMFFDDDEDEEFSRPGRTIRTDDGYDLIGPVARIPIAGTLVQKLGSLRPMSGMTGYSGIREAFCRAMDDQQAEAIYLDIDSPGGEVAGCFDLVDLIHSARGDKPIWAILNESAYSAAYAIASAADHITVPRTGGVGSIGVIAMRVDFTKALDKDGIKVDFLVYGEKKPHGHPETEMGSEERDDLQAEINTMGELFVSTVARNRGLDAAVVKGAQAGTYLGAPGVELGLADAVAAPDAAFRQLLAELA